MISFTKQSGITTYHLVECIADTESDVQSLPNNWAVGSTCLVIESSSIYILNGNKEWVKM